MQFDNTRGLSLLTLQKMSKKGTLTQGNNQNKLVERIKKITDCKYVLLTSSGTSAIHLILKSLNMSNYENQVIIPSYASDSLMIALRWANAKEKFVDSSRSNFSIDVKEVVKKITKKTKVVIVPYMYGDFIEIEELKSSGIFVIEDIAHCTGGIINKRRVGSFGDIGMTSFGQFKYLDGGYGGALFTNNKKIIEKIISIFKGCSVQSDLAYNYSIPNIFSEIIYQNSFRLEREQQIRRKIAESYIRNLEKLDVEIIQTAINNSFYHRFMIGIKNKKEFLEKIRAKGIMCSSGIRCPLHMIVNHRKSFPNTEHYWNHFVALPIRPTLKNQEIERIIKTVLECLE